MKSNIFFSETISRVFFPSKAKTAGGTKKRDWTTTTHDRSMISTNSTPHDFKREGGGGEKQEQGEVILPRLPLLPVWRLSSRDVLSAWRTTRAVCDRTPSMHQNRVQHFFPLIIISTHTRTHPHTHTHTHIHTLILELILFRSYDSPYPLLHFA